MKPNQNETAHSADQKALTFSGNIYIFYEFDIGDDIDVQKLKQSNLLQTYAMPLPKFFKNYHIIKLCRVYSKYYQNPKTTNCLDYQK